MSAPDMSISSPRPPPLLLPDFCPGHSCLQTDAGNPHPYPWQPWSGGWGVRAGSYEFVHPGILGPSEGDHWGEGVTRPSWVPGSRGGFSSVPVWTGKAFICMEDSSFSGVKLQPVPSMWLQSCSQSPVTASSRWGLLGCLHHVPLTLAIQEFPEPGFPSHGPQGSSTMPTPGR